ncbi:MAG: succinate dehydrogenase, hydrophobic membrane anchor protein [Flavobacteriaceae bacterium]
MDIITPTKLVRGLGSAKEGTDHFWRQRLTAVANIPLLSGFVWLIACMAGDDYQSVKATLSHPFSAIFLLGVIISATIHMRIGMQVIIEDYVHGEGLKIVSLIANTLFSVAIALAAIFAILKLAFGA